MATLNTTNIKHASSGSNNIVLASDGKVTFPQNTGNILQVVSAQKTDTWSSSTTSSYVTVTGLTLSITPTSTSSKVFVCFNMNIGNSGQGNGMGAKILRGSTDLLIADASDSRTRAYVAQFTLTSNTNNTCNFVSPCFLDSPNSTSAVTYTFQVFNTGGTIYINRSGEDSNASGNPRGACYAYAMEVAA